MQKEIKFNPPVERIKLFNTKVLGKATKLKKKRKHLGKFPIIPKSPPLQHNSDIFLFQNYLKNAGSPSLIEVRDF